MPQQPIEPTQDGESLERANCYACNRPQDHCLCAEVRVVDNRTPVLILQHQRERGHAFGTARLAEMGLRNAELLVDFQGRLKGDGSLAQKLEGCGLLYPHASALDLSQLEPAQRPKKLVVIDGTWRHARSMYRDIPGLSDLPHYTLPSGQTSGFEIRKQPEEHCLSTLEAIHSALQCLEPETPNLDDLLRPFAAMQKQQLVAMLPHSPRAKKPSRWRKGRRLPQPLVDGYDSLVVAYGESSTVGTSQRPRHLLTFAAERPSTGERMQVVLEEYAQYERHLPYMRLAPKDLAGAVSLSEFQAAWQDFRRPGDVVAAWNKSTLDLLRGELPGIGDSLLLKAAYFNLRRSRGALDEIILLENLMSAERLERNQTLLNRTEERLENALALTAFLRGQGQAS
ncbi:MAG: DTW domain-containing protein YfiP [Planctomycetota bacterium]|jgi:DTW domain-containing protein YfiP